MDNLESRRLILTEEFDEVWAADGVDLFCRCCSEPLYRCECQKENEEPLDSNARN